MYNSCALLPISCFFSLFPLSKLPFPAPIALGHLCWSQVSLSPRSLHIWPQSLEEAASTPELIPLFFPLFPLAPHGILFDFGAAGSVFLLLIISVPPLCVPRLLALCCWPHFCLCSPLFFARLPFCFLHLLFVCWGPSQEASWPSKLLHF